MDNPCTCGHQRGNHRWKTVDETGPCMQEGCACAVFVEHAKAPAFEGRPHNWIEHYEGEPGPPIVVEGCRNVTHWSCSNCGDVLVAPGPLPDDGPACSGSRAPDAGHALAREQWQREQRPHLDRIVEAQDRLIEAKRGYIVWLQRGIDHGWQPLAKPEREPDA